MTDHEIGRRIKAKIEAKLSGGEHYRGFDFDDQGVMINQAVTRSGLAIVRFNPYLLREADVIQNSGLYTPTIEGIHRRYSNAASISIAAAITGYKEFDFMSPEKLGEDVTIEKVDTNFTIAHNILNTGVVRQEYVETLGLIFKLRKHMLANKPRLDALAREIWRKN